MTREQIIAENPIVPLLESRGVKLKPCGKELMALCPLHEDKNPSFSVNPQTGVWHCHAGCGGGSVIDLLARFEGVTPADILRRHKDAPEAKHEQTRPTVEKAYPYHDATGALVYEVLRLVPKSFRQRRYVNGSAVWGMDGVERVLYRLPEVLKSQEVWIVEGEKDADTLASHGFCATCNVGGAGKWLDSYTETLAGKDVVLCGDSDEPGQKHVQTVFDSIAGKVKTARIVRLPDFKDVSDFAKTVSADDFRPRMLALRDAAQSFTKGIHIPVYSLAELESQYAEHVRNLATSTMDLGKWIPTLGRNVRGLVPGELVTIIADTGVGKTYLLQNLAITAGPLPVVMFEMELPPELMFERFVAIGSKMPARVIEAEYQKGETLGREFFETKQTFRHIHVCTEARLNPEKLESLINKSELKIGQRPKVVLIDYIQLMAGNGKSRYERMSNVAEELKIVAKATKTILFVTSQVHRKEEDSPELFLHDAKDSGSIENSSGLVLGAWRDQKDASCLKLKVLKNTKGKAGFVVDCNFDGDTGAITERALR